MSDLVDADEDLEEIVIFDFRSSRSNRSWRAVATNRRLVPANEIKPRVKGNFVIQGGTDQENLQRSQMVSSLDHQVQKPASRGC